MPTSNTSSKSSSRKNSKGNDSAPQTFDEFLVQNRLQDWPEPLTSEGPLDIEGNNLGFGELEDIHQKLADAAPMDFSVFDDLASRLEDIESLLFKYTDAILVREGAEDEKSEEVFLTETGEGKRQELVRSKPKPQESVHDIKKRSVDYFKFPGFVKHELNELPSQLEAPQILNEVTKAQEFNAGFKKFWQKIFLSEASVAVTQDLFWYFFIEKFDREHKADQAKLFDRLADSFVALFFSVNPEVKDKFFQVYADCLAQAVYVCFYNAFPESAKRFDEYFIDDLVNISAEWITGVKPVPESWRRWDIGKLVRPPAKEKKRAEKKAPSAAAAFHGAQNLTLDMDSFHKVVNRLGHDRTRSIVSHTKGSDKSPGASKLSFNHDFGEQYAADGTVSHPMGPGPQFETVSFDTLGQSALVSHFLRQRKLQGELKPQLKVRRTQVSKLPPKSQTYRDYIDERAAKSEVLTRQYQQATRENEEEIARIQRKNIKSNREMNEISRQIMFNKNPVDIKIMSERVLDMRERQLAPTVKVGGDVSGSEEEDESGEVNQSKLKIQITG